ncbi:hypothetical protein BC826DRAFT_971858 [Russula brevipes]|nr:hypothetical protein BC826DRAFT_971858 [Russula brevipes]
MSLLPTSNGLVLPESVPNFQRPLPRPQPDFHAVSQPIPRNAHPDSLLASGSLDNADPLTIFASRVPQGPVQNVVPSSHPFLTNYQPSLNFVWPTTLPPLPDGPYWPYQSLPTNQAAQAAFQPPRFAARASQDLLTAPPVAVRPSSLGMDPLAAASLPPLVPNAPVRYADAINHGAGSFGLDQPTADGGYARASERARGGPSVWATRRGREVPFVRVEDRIEWVSRDLLKMTLWFDWSPDVEARHANRNPGCGLLLTHRRLAAPWGCRVLPLLRICPVDVLVI